MGNYFKSKKSGMVGFTVSNNELADALLNYFVEKGSNLAWRNDDNTYNRIEILISEVELRRIGFNHYSDVTKEMRQRGYDIGWPAIYGDPHFTYL